MLPRTVEKAARTAINGCERGNDSRGAGGVLLGTWGYEFAGFLQKMQTEPRESLFVKGRTQNGNHEVSEVRSIVIELKVAHHAMLGEIFGNAGFGDAEMVRELRLERIGAATACASP